MTFSILSPSSVMNLLHAHSWPVTSATVITSGTSQVFRCSIDAEELYSRQGKRLPHDSLIIRVASSSQPLQTARPLAQHTSWAQALKGTSVPFAVPLINGVLLHESLCATLWEDLGNCQGINYEEFGKALLVFQEKGLQALKDVDLPYCEDWESISAAYRNFFLKGAIDTKQYEVIQQWIEHLKEEMSLLSPSPTVLVHDDLWPKNVIQTSSGISFIDPDNLCWGRADFDLSFVVRGTMVGSTTAEQAREFEKGYGSSLPSLKEAKITGSLHLLRWAVSALGGERIMDDKDARKEFFSKWQYLPDEGEIFHY